MKIILGIFSDRLQPISVTQLVIGLRATTAMQCAAVRFHISNNLRGATFNRTVLMSPTKRFVIIFALRFNVISWFGFED